jgi:hypothetical protein
MKICIDIGHGKNTYPPSKGIKDFAEFSFNNEVGKFAKEVLEYNGFGVYLSQPFDSDEVALKTRSNNINKEKCDIGFSIHADASSNKEATGHHAFYWHTSSKGKALAEIWLRHADETLSNKSRGIRACVPDTWTNFHMTRETDCPFILMEHGYFTNEHERENLLKSPDFQKNCALVIGKTACEYFKMGFKNPFEEDSQDLTPIMGSTQVKPQQMVSFALKGNEFPALPYCSTQELAKIFIEEALVEGVRADIAWAQSLKETGYFKYGGIVLPTQNNYSGIGALNGNGKGKAASFDSPRLGVRAQIQHLKAYASTELLKRECIDPRFKLVKRGSAKYVEWLGYKNNPNGAGWAYPGDGYGYDIVKIVNLISKEPYTKEEHWGDKYIQKLKDLELISGDHKALDELTWAEFGAVVVKLLDMVMLK